jgi:hypothetical protein
MAILFEYAVILKPTAQEEKEQTGTSKLVLGPSHLLAKSQEEATMKITRLIPVEYDDKLERLDITIRPF